MNSRSILCVAYGLAVLTGSLIRIQRSRRCVDFQDDSRAHLVENYLKINVFKEFVWRHYLERMR